MWERWQKGESLHMIDHSRLRTALEIDRKIVGALQTRGIKQKGGPKAAL
jgi:hypothetical protein